VERRKERGRERERERLTFAELEAPDAPIRRRRRAKIG
jgi:hypothetical protein